MLRRYVLLALAPAVALLAAGGCSKSKGVAIGSGPKLVLKWPEPPTIDHHGGAGEMQFHSAMLSRRAEGKFVIFNASVIEPPAGEANAGGGEDLLEAATFAFKENETSRTEFAAGRKKHRGLDITSKSTTTGGKAVFSRRKVVVIDGRIFDASVGSSDEETLNSREVRAFLDSFRIED